MHYHVDRPGELAKAPSRHGSQAPPDAVAIHGSSQHLADSEANAWTGFVFTLPVKDCHISRKAFPALFVNRLEIRVLQKTRAFGKPSRR